MRRVAAVLGAALLLPVIGGCNSSMPAFLKNAVPDSLFGRSAQSTALVAPPPSVTEPAPPAPAPRPSEPSADVEEKPELVCNPRAVNWALGKPSSQSYAERVRIAAGAKEVRVLKPGQGGTLTTNPDRLTIRLNARKNIANITCS